MEEELLSESLAGSESYASEDGFEPEEDGGGGDALQAVDGDGGSGSDEDYSADEGDEDRVPRDGR